MTPKVTFFNTPGELERAVRRVLDMPLVMDGNYRLTFAHLRLGDEAEGNIEQDGMCVEVKVNGKWRWL